MIVAPQEEYPLVCIGVSQGSSPNPPVAVEYMNLNSNTSWFTRSGLGKSKHHPGLKNTKESQKKESNEMFFSHCDICPTEKPVPDVVQVNQLDGNSLLVLLESKWNTVFELFSLTLVYAFYVKSL